jgi:PilZ domain
MTEILFAVKRIVPRFLFTAEAEVTAVRSGAHLVAHLSEMSVNGCYIDTPEGFPVGTELRLSVRYGGSKCELTGRGIYKHDGWGMGVAFENVTAEQRYIIDAWLTELARKTK